MEKAENEKWKQKWEQKEQNKQSLVQYSLYSVLSHYLSILFCSSQILVHVCEGARE